MLVGMMGTGKTTVGKVCAERLGRELVDTDALVERDAGTTVGEIFESRGEPEFRRLERDAVAAACSATEPTVIACGGGVVLDAENRQRLQESGFVVWLQAAPEVLGDRVRGPGGVRPLIAPGPGATPVETLERLASDRAAQYEDVAHAAVATDDLTIDEVADAVLEVYAS